MDQFDIDNLHKCSKCGQLHPYEKIVTDRPIGDNVLCSQFIAEWEKICDECITDNDIQEQGND